MDTSNSPIVRSSSHLCESPAFPVDDLKVDGKQKSDVPNRAFTRLPRFVTNDVEEEKKEPRVMKIDKLLTLEMDSHESSSIQGSSLSPDDFSF